MVTAVRNEPALAGYKSYTLMCNRPAPLWVWVLMAVSSVWGLFSSRPASALEQGLSLHNQSLSCAVEPLDGSYTIQLKDAQHPILHAIVGAEIDHHWVKSTDYPKHQISQAT